MFAVVVMVLLVAYCGWFALQAVVPAGPRGVRRLAAKDRTALVTSGLTVLAAALLFRVFVPVGGWSMVSWLLVGVLFAGAVGFAALRWGGLPTRRLRTNGRTGAQRPRSWAVVGTSVGLAVGFVAFCGFVNFAAFFA